MKSRVEEAANRKMQGRNCAQAVACTYCDLAGIDEQMMADLTQGYGVGTGLSTLSTCGAVIGAVNVLGAINKDPKKTMKSAKKIITTFNEQNGAIDCWDLKGLKDGVVKRECIDCVRDAAALLEAELEQE